MICNTGSDAWNYQVRDLANAVAAEIPGTTVSINSAAPPDKRSYRVSFGYFRSLAPNHQPQVDLRTAVRDLAEGLEATGFANRNFRESHLIRLVTLTALRDAGIVARDLRHRGRAAA